MDENKSKNLTESEEAVVKNNQKLVLARRAYAQAVHADDQALELWEQGRLTAEDFKSVTGHSPVVALRRRYELKAFNADLPLRVNVKAGRITMEEYETIVGKPYEPMEEDVAKALAAINMTDQTASEGDAEPEGEAAQDSPEDQV